MKKDIRREKNWYNYCHKNIFIENLYGRDIPALDDVDIEYMDFKLSPNKEMVSSVQFVIRLRALPDNMPAKWRISNVNCLKIKLDVIEVDCVNIKSAATGRSAIDVYTDANNIVLRVSGAITGIIKYPLEYKQTLEDGTQLVDDKCFAITEIKGIHED